MDDTSTTTINIDTGSHAEILRIQQDDSLAEKEKIRQIFKIMKVPDTFSVEGWSTKPKAEAIPDKRVEYTFTEDTDIFSRTELTTLYTLWELPTSKQNFINMCHYIYTSYNSISSFKTNERDTFIRCPRAFVQQLFAFLRQHCVDGQKHTFK